MKGGGCKEVVVAWEKCVDAHRDAEDGAAFVESCLEQTQALKACMEQHADYYQPMLEAEQGEKEKGATGAEAEATGVGGGEEEAGVEGVEVAT